MMPAFYGLARKMALLPIHLFLLGWIAYIVGFVWDMIDDFQKGPLMYSGYATAVGGPILYVFAMLHTGLPGVPSKIVGSITACLSAIYFIPAGSVLYTLGQVEYEDEHPDAKYTIKFVGLLIASFCWMLMLMFSVFYKYKRESQEDQYIQLYDENTSTFSARNVSSFFAGIARKLVIPLIVLSATGWCVFIVGVDKLVKYMDDPNNDMPFNMNFPDDLDTWGASSITVLLFLAALMHAGCSGRTSRIVGVFTALLSMIFKVFIGSVIYRGATIIYFMCHDLGANCSILHSEVPIFVLYMFSGGVATCFFWASVRALWPFYKQEDMHTHSGHVQRSPLTSSYRRENDETVPLVSRR